MTSITEGNVTVLQTEGDERDHPADVLLCSEIGAKLTKLYPGWAWKIEIPPGNDVVIVRNLDLDARGKFGFVMPKSGLGPDLHHVMLAGGELLERWKRRARGTDGSDIPSYIDALTAKPQT